MNNLEKFNEVFTAVFGVEESALTDEFVRDKVDNWDSVRQLSLTNGLEDAFDIMFDPEDIIGCTSYDAAKRIVAKYDIVL